VNYLTVKEAGEKWGLGTRIVTLYCTEGRIAGAVKRGNLWLIPEYAERPSDKRRRGQKSHQKALCSDLHHVIAATAIPFPGHNPDAVLDNVKEDRFKLVFEAELSYLRGRFQHVLQCYHKTEGDAAARLRITPAAIAASITIQTVQHCSSMAPQQCGFTIIRMTGMKVLCYASAAGSMQESTWRKR